jgi:hypothetical protein
VRGQDPKHRINYAQPKMFDGCTSQPLKCLMAAHHSSNLEVDVHVLSPLHAMAYAEHAKTTLRHVGNLQINNI